MGLEGFVQQDVAGTKLETAAIAGFLAGSLDEQRGVTSKMMMAREYSSGLVQARFLTGQNERHQARCADRNIRTLNSLRQSTTPSR